MSPEVIDLETFLARHNASRQDYGDAGLHRRAGANETSWQRSIETQRLKDAKLALRRELLSVTYHRLVAIGQIVPPTNLETLTKIASGNPDNLSVRAAQRVLAKRAARKVSNAKIHVR